MLPVEKESLTHTREIDAQSEQNVNESRRLKKALAECRASVILASQKLNEKEIEIASLTQEIRELRSLANYWVEFQNSRIFVVYKGYIAVHRFPIVGRVIGVAKRFVFRIFGKRR